jgi:Replication-relaxation
MNGLRQTPARVSRWTRDPVISDGQPVVVYPTERDIEIFKLLTRYRYLPSDYIHAFVGGSLDALSRRLNLLSRKPNLYLARPHQQRDNANANYRRLVYELDERGSRVLRERGLSFLAKSYHRNFAHELMVAQVMASFELGAREQPNVKLISWSEILASENTPRATRESTTPKLSLRLSPLSWRTAHCHNHRRRPSIRDRAPGRWSLQLPVFPRGRSRLWNRASRHQRFRAIVDCEEAMCLHRYR